MLKRIICVLILVVTGVSLLSGCAGKRQGNEGNLAAFVLPGDEASWIRNGDPIEFEGELWYPHDGIETLLDSEVYLMGEFRGVQFFVEKKDVRPYERLYTKFGKNKFRFFKREPQ